MPERSFFFRGRQFPLCARCTGVLLGYFFGVLILLWRPLPMGVCAAFCLIMYIDWKVQKAGILASTNTRRFITGIFCGIGYSQIVIRLFSLLSAKLYSLIFP